MQTALRTRFLGGTAGNNVFWVRAPQGAGFPRITLTLISDGRDQDFDGFMGMQSARVQVDFWATSYATVRSMAEAAFTAVVPPGVSGGIQFGRAFIESERDLFEKTETEEIYRNSTDLIVWWRPV